MKEEWYCPVCKKELVITGKEFYKTHSEHCCDPNGQIGYKRDIYQCSDEKCISHNYEAFWNIEGDLYTKIHIVNGRSFKDYCIGGLISPFNSFSRKLDVEVYKKGLKSKKYLPSFLCLFIYKPCIEYNYKADLDGNVISTKYQLSFWKKSGHGYIHVSPFYKTLNFLNNRFKNKKKKGKVDFKKDVVSINRSWPYRLFEFYVKTFYKKHLINI